MGLNHTLTAWYRVALLVFSSLFVLSTAHAEMLLDPTQPPAALFNAADAEINPATPMLQSIILSPTHKAAVINGKKVMLGGKYEDATLIKLNDHEATLRNPDKSLQKLTMNDAIYKKLTSPVAPAPNKKNKRLTHSN